MTPGQEERGRGAVAGIGSRIGAFLVDTVVCIAIALLAGFRPGERGYGITIAVAFVVIELVFVALAGQTPGMRALGVAVVRMPDGGKPVLGWVAVRTVLLATILPALIVDASGRAMHDRAAGTVMLRTR